MMNEDVDGDYLELVRSRFDGIGILASRHLAKEPHGVGLLSEADFTLNRSPVE